MDQGCISALDSDLFACKLAGNERVGRSVARPSRRGEAVISPQPEGSLDSLLIVNMKTTGRILSQSAAVALTAATSTGRAAEFFDDFESYSAGANIHGQGGWKGWDNDSAAGAVVSTAFAASGTKSVRVTGASDLVHEFSGATSGQWNFSLDQYIPSTSSGDTYLILMNKYRDGGGGDYDNWSVQTHVNLGTGQIIVDMATGEAPLTLVKNAWINWTFNIDLDANKVTEYYNHQLLSTHAWQSGGANALSAVDLYANGAGPVYYDNVSVSQVPEPTAVALLGLGGLALLLCRRSR